MKRLACPIQILSQFRDDHPEISLIRFQWQDYSGVVRARVLVLEAVIPLIAKGKPIQAAGIAIDCTVNNIILHRKPPRGMYWALALCSFPPRDCIGDVRFGLRTTQLDP
jgi:hypothetical protein